MVFRARWLFRGGDACVRGRVGVRACVGVCVCVWTCVCFLRFKARDCFLECGRAEGYGVWGFG